MRKRGVCGRTITNACVLCNLCQCTNVQNDNGNANIIRRSAIVVALTVNNNQRDTDGDDISRMADTMM